ncbi:bacterial MORN repeat-containing protein [Tokyovirus A1]|uniref:bacterial MORN repeat-containing protein n=1 Tax=Tokyovirus A1 TaxID=1826170 RepID=UPI0007A98238|nr:bacterial MORN repeat-containing protein [Tokyovirus A1]BAU80195.1 bacterial MORN repeat-containing protein [Tokyovirus A1]
MNSLENLCFEKVKKLFVSKKIKVEQFKVLPENILERVCSFVPTPQQVRALGLCVRWMKGVLREKGFYVDGKLEGQLIKWDNQGRVLERAEYKSGRKNGETVLYKPSKNSVFVIENYRHGELHGEKLVYFSSSEQDEEQKLKKRKTYHKGLKEGKFFWYGLDGSILKEQLWVRGILVNNAR